MKIPIKGVIISSQDQWIYDWFEIEATSPAKVNSLIEQANGEELEVEINSPGGYVDDGSEIYTMLKAYKGKVTVNIVGMAASSASIIAMAGNPTRISPTATLMIHNASMIAAGDHNDMDHASTVLKQTNASIANAYRLKTGMDEAELLELMDQETYFTAQSALSKGFVDEIMFDSAGVLKATASLSAVNAAVIPPEVINNIRKNKETLQRPAASIDPAKNKPEKQEGVKKMNLDELKKDHPELCNQIIEESRKAAIESERARVNELQELAETPGAKEIVQKHISNGGTAAEAAIEFMKSSKDRIDQVKNDRKTDGEKSGAADVPAAPTNTIDDKDEKTKRENEERMRKAAEKINQNRSNTNTAGGRV